VLCSEQGVAHQFQVRSFVHSLENLLILNRYHTIQEFNKGVYDYIIATDEGGGANEEIDSASDDTESENGRDEDDGCKFGCCMRHLH
jgi:ATP-dependent RNA helicase DDX56/DBP9